MDIESSRIGILNLQNVDNFGCVLGAYAIQRAVKDLTASEVELIDYRPQQNERTFMDKIRRTLRSSIIYGIKGTLDRHSNAMREWKSILSQREKQHIDMPIREGRFADFRDAFLCRSEVFSALKSGHAPDYDTYIVGSDVVWLLDDLWLERSPAFLQFTDGKNCRRIAYAASLGDFSERNNNKRIVKHLYKKGLERFDMVSVREQSSADYLAPLYAGKIYCCMDPTLLLPASSYDAIEKASSVSTREEYVYVYMLNETGDLYKNINRISNDISLPIVRCCEMPGGYKNVLEAAEEDGPAEFLSRIKNASLVITNSFHAVCFSLLYHKNFLAVRRIIQAYKTEELLKRLNLMDRYIDAAGSGEPWKKSIDYEEVDRRLKIWHEESMGYLKKALDVQF